MCIRDRICATDAGREGELIFRLVYHQCGCKKPVEDVYKRQLETNVFQASSIAQKYNCNLRRLDFQQEQGLMSCLPLAQNLICLLYTSNRPKNPANARNKNVLVVGGSGSGKTLSLIHI